MSNEIVFYDLETTGISRDSNNVRIIEISAVKVDAETLEEVDTLYYKLNNDGVSIQQDAMETHHITEDDLVGLPTFTQVASNVYEFFRGCDVGGYRCTFFDNPILYFSFLRAGIDWNYRKIKVYDIYTLYKKYNSGKLSDIYRSYTNKTLSSDTKNLTAILDIYRLQNKNEEYLNESELSAYEKNLDIAGNFKIRTNEVGAKEVFVDFGKYKGISIDKIDAKYFYWISNSSDSFPIDTRHYAKKIYEKKGGN